MVLFQVGLEESKENCDLERNREHGSKCRADWFGKERIKLEIDGDVANEVRVGVNSVKSGHTFTTRN